MKAEKESSPKAAENKTRQKQPEALPLYQNETKNSYSQNQELNNSHAVIPAVHNIHSAYGKSAELMYRKLEESFEKTGDLDHLDTKQKEKDYIRTLSFLEARNYNDIKSKKFNLKSIQRQVSDTQVVKDNVENPRQLSGLIAQSDGSRFKPPIVYRNKDKKYTIDFNTNQTDYDGSLITNESQFIKFITRVINESDNVLPLDKHISLRLDEKSDIDNIKAILRAGATMTYRPNSSENKGEKEKSNDKLGTAQELVETKENINIEPKRSSEAVQNEFDNLLGDEIQISRIKDLFNQLTPEEMADYRSKVSTQSSDPVSIEESLKAYIESKNQKRKDQDKLESIKTKLFGLEDIYKRYVEFSKSLPSTTEVDADGVRTTTINKEYEPDKKQLTEDLITSGFKGGIPEFETFIKNYQTGFENKTAQLAIDYLQGYKHFLYVEQNKLSDDAYLESLLARLKASGAKQKFDKADEAKNSVFNLSYAEKPHAPQEVAFKNEMKADADQKAIKAEKNIDDFKSLTPLAVDEGFDKKGFAQCTTTAEIKIFLQNYITKKNLKANNSIAKIQKNPEHIYELDELFVIAKKQEQVKEDSIYDSILKAKYDKIHQFDVLKDIGLGILSVAIIIATWGAATPVVIGGTILSAGISIGLAYEAIEEYKTKQDFHDVGLLSDDPSIAWVVLAIAGVALDAAALAKVLQSAQPIATAAKAFNDAKDTAKALSKLEKDLLKIEGLNDKLQQNIVKQAKIKAQEQKLLEGFAQARNFNYATIPGLLQTGELSARLIFAIRKGILTFDGILLELEASRLLKDIGTLSKDDLSLLKQAFTEAKSLAKDDKLAIELEQALAEKNFTKVKSLVRETKTITKVDENLIKLGLDELSINKFMSGETVIFEFVSKTEGYVSGFVTKSNDEIHSYIFYIKDKSGDGIKSFLEFREKSYNIAKSLNISNIELGGSSIINPDVLAMVKRMDFEKKVIDVPASIGGKPGETMELFVKKFKIK